MAEARRHPAPRRMRATLLGATLAALLVPLGAAPPSAHAQGQLTSIGKGNAKEIARRMSIELDGQLARLRESLTIASESDEPLQVHYHFRLPLEAAVTGAHIELGKGQRSELAIVDANASARFIEEPRPGHEPDLGLLRMVAVNSGDPGYREYELRLYPLPARKSAELHLDLVLPMHTEDGIDTLRLPLGDKTRGAKRAALQVDVKSAQTRSGLRGNGKLLAKRSKRGKGYRYFAPKHGELVIQSRPARASTTTQAQVAIVPFGPRSGVAAVRLWHPHKGTRGRGSVKRLLLLVDTSTSLGPKGLAAARQLSESLLASVGSGTQVAAYRFDREATPFFEGFKANTRQVRALIDRELGSSAQRSGSNLRHALSTASAALGAALSRSDTLVVVVSDGLVPTTLDVAATSEMLTGSDGKGSQFLAAVLVPDDAPLPDMRYGSLAGLATRRGGRALAMWHGESRDRGSELLSELGMQPPLESIEVELDKGNWIGAHFGERLLAGNSELALGFYEGASPSRVRVEASRGGVPVSILASAIPKERAKHYAQLALADATTDSLPDDAGPLSDRENRQRFVSLAQRHSVVTSRSAAVIVDASDAFALERLGMAKRWGGSYFRRMATPAERARHAGAKLGPLRHRHRSEDPSHQDTGQVDPEMVARLIQSHVVPVARGCYDKLLRRDRSAGGKILLHLEVARGEVHDARLTELPKSLAPIEQCILDASYAMPAPTVLQGEQEEMVTVARYPLRFRLRDKGAPRPRGKVEQKGDPITPDRRPSFDPLTGLPEDEADL